MGVVPEVTLEQTEQILMHPRTPNIRCPWMHPYYSVCWDDWVNLRVAACANGWHFVTVSKGVVCVGCHGLKSSEVGSDRTHVREASKRYGFLFYIGKHTLGGA
jgi:hypothetical protein